MESVADVLEGLKRSLGLPAKRLAFSKARERIPGARDLSGHVADAVWFNSIIVAGILLDTTMAGVEADWSEGDTVEDTLLYWTLDTVITLLFMTEAVTRMHHLRWEYFADPWNIFDFICACFGMAAVAQTAQSANTRDITNLRVIKTLKGFRALRLLRIARHIGGLKIVQGLWLLIISLLSGVKTLFWIFCFWIICLYVMAVFLVELIRQEPVLRESWSDMDVYVGNIARTMVTLWQVVTFDAWASDVGRPIMEGHAAIAFAAIFLAMMVISFGVINLILAVMIEHVRTAMANMGAKTERRLKASESWLVFSMAADFKPGLFDIGTADLTIEEFEEALRREDVVSKLRLVGIMTTEAMELFEILDVRQTNKVALQDFLLGLQKLRGAASGQDLLHVISSMKKQSHRAKGYVESVRRMNERADLLQQRFNGMGLRLTSEIEENKEVQDHARHVVQLAKDRSSTLRTMDDVQRTTFPQATLPPQGFAAAGSEADDPGYRDRPFSRSSRPASRGSRPTSRGSAWS